MEMPKLHELLAVEGNLKGQAEKVGNELANTFEKKRHLFEETRKSFTPTEENAQTVVEEQKDIQTTVAKEIEWISRHLAKALDASYNIDLANAKASADVVLEEDDETFTILKDVPATALLQLEKRLKAIQGLIQAIPTLDPAKGFEPYPEHKFKGVYAARPVTKERTRKSPKVITLAPPTDKHPAQVQMVTVDEPIGKIQEQEWSSLIHPSTKSDLLDRCETLIRAVTKARARANEQDIDLVGNKIGKKLLDFIFKPLFEEKAS
jgi:uncharacterized FlaG/YvyC family protein